MPYMSTPWYINIIGRSMTQSDVEEVVSDVFWALWNNADKIDANRFKAYLGSMARNRAKNKLREMGMDTYLEDDIVIVSDNTPETAFEEQEQDLLVKQALLSMQHPDREIFLRHYYYYQTVSEIADEMDMNISTVKTRLSRGREKLKDSFSKGGYFNGKEDHRPIGLHSR